MSTEDNITLTEEPVSSPAPAPEQQEVKLTDIEVTNENMALNLMVSFLNVAQRRGAFSLDESAKIWECIQKFVQVAAANQA
jgi:hypothetical protein